jgi:uncharacterized repeat protein (TIGR03803 family)
MWEKKRWFMVSGLLTVFGVALVLPPAAAPASKYTVLHRFNGQDGSHPFAGLVFDSAGNLYGTTREGGLNGAGTVFELTPIADGSWKESVLHTFSYCTGCANGWNPASSLIFDAKGNLFGTTPFGPDGSTGVVFQLKPEAEGTWTGTVLHSFSGPDGLEPTGSLVFDAAGSLYGTTLFGGSGCVGSTFCGVVFRLTLQSDGSWTERVVHAFHDHPAAEPAAALTFDATGNLYGTASNGSPIDGFGAVFILAPRPGGGWAYSVLHTFQENPSSFPRSSLVLDKAGNLYGTASDCDLGNNCHGNGVVFEISP